MLKPLEVELVCFGAALALWAAVARSAADERKGAPSGATTPNHLAGVGVVARFKGGQISVANLEAAIANKDPDMRQRLLIPEGRLGLLRDLENYDLLVLEAERRGYARHPAVIDAKRQAAIDAMLAADLRVDPATIPAADVRREFESQRARVTRPLRLSDVNGALREQLAEQRFEEAQTELVKQLYEQYKPEIHASLVDAITLAPLPSPDQPQGFPAAPPDPRAAPRRVEADGI